MKKTILFIALVLLVYVLVAQTEEQPQVAAPEESQGVVPVQPQEQVKTQEMNLKKIHFPQAFIHAGKEYSAGDYWLVLAVKDGQPLFTVSNAQKETLFEELAIVKARSGGRRGSSFQVRKEMMKDNEYFRVKVTTAGQWLMGYFLIKK